jgi:predicted kinase
MFYLVFGISGSGKSTISKYLSKKLDAEIINTDNLHSLLFPIGERTETGDFTPEQLQEIYRGLRPLVHYISKIASDKNFIVEGNFRFKSQREFVIQKLKENNMPYKMIFVELKNEEEAKRRIDNRHFNEGAPDTFEDYLKIKKSLRNSRFERGNFY